MLPRPPTAPASFRTRPNARKSESARPMAGDPRGLWHRRESPTSHVPRALSRARRNGSILRFADRRRQRLVFLLAGSGQILGGDGFSLLQHVKGWSFPRALLREVAERPVAQAPATFTTRRSGSQVCDTVRQRDWRGRREGSVADRRRLQPVLAARLAAYLADRVPRRRIIGESTPPDISSTRA